MADVNFDKAAQAWNIVWDADWVTAVAFLGGARKLAAGNNLGQIFVWDLPEDRKEAPTPVRRLDGHKNQVVALAASPDGRWLYSASLDHSVRVWDLQAPADGSAETALDPKAREAAVKKGQKEKALIKVEVQKAAKVLDAHKEWVRTISLTPDGKKLLSGDDKGQAILWDVPEGKEIRRLPCQGWLQAVALTADARLAVTCEAAVRRADFPNAIKIWDLSSGVMKLDLGKELKAGNEGVIGMAAAAFSLDGKLLCLGTGGERDGNQKTYLMDPDTGKKVRELVSHQYGVTGAVFHPDGKHLLTCGRDTLVKVWHIADGKMVKDIGKVRGGQFKDWIHAISVSADGQWLAAADMAGAVEVWSLTG